ncbi:MAG TPA: ammonium transporter [Candidatus Bathyarchaeia archaeon]|nr:ammonium transporter [Candidatus Bathyarchaeia archaeon]
MEGNERSRKKWAAAFLIISIVIGIALLPQLNEYGGVSSMTSSENDFMYEKSIDILTMLLVGFGFLMVFVRKYGYTSVTATFLLVSLSLPLYFLVRPYLWGSAANLSTTNISLLVYAEFAAASLLIAIGGPLGRINTSQYLLIGLLFTPLYALNEWILFSGVLIPAGAFLDTAGSIMIHAFGAYFALGMIIMLTSKRDHEISVETSKSSNQFALIGSAFLWILWPSFCSVMVPTTSVPLVAINTVMALCGATIATYVFSVLIRGKIEVGDIANASLAGGVAIGASVANVTPGWSVLIGASAGAISVIGYTMIQPRLQKLTGGIDTCGVHNLHGMPGVFGGLVAMAFVATPLWQLAGIVSTVVFAIFMGIVVGFIVSRLGIKETPYDDKEEFNVPEGN